jgi:hypothetical protein
LYSFAGKDVYDRCWGRCGETKAGIEIAATREGFEREEREEIGDEGEILESAGCCVEG